MIRIEEVMEAMMVLMKKRDQAGRAVHGGFQSSRRDRVISTASKTPMKPRMRKVAHRELFYLDNMKRTTYMMEKM